MKTLIKTTKGEHVITDAPQCYPGHIVLQENVPDEEFHMFENGKLVKDKKRHDKAQRRKKCHDLEGMLEQIEALEARIEKLENKNGTIE